MSTLTDIQARNGIADAAYLVTPDDNNDLPNGTAEGLLCGTAGTCNLIDGRGNLCTNYPLQQGYNPIRVQRVKTGGTASNIWALG